jgi:hypothetical protein
MKALIPYIFSLCILNVSLLAHYKNCNSRAEFFKKIIQEKQFQTIYDLIKDESYRTQRECYLRGNCAEHPMDEFVNAMRSHAIDIKSLGERTLAEQEKQSYLEFARTNKIDIQQLNQAKERADKRIAQVKKEQQKEERRLLFDTVAQENISEEMLSHLKNLYRLNDLAGNLTFFVEKMQRDAYVAISTEDKSLHVSLSFFLLRPTIQSGILAHEFTHLRFLDPLFELFLGEELNRSTQEIKHSCVTRFHEYRADQLHAFKDSETALFMKSFLYAHMRQTAFWEKLTTHPHNINRYNALKIIVQLHKTLVRCKKRIPHPRYTQEKYEKYVVGYEKAWDKWCEQQKK